MRTPIGMGDRYVEIKDFDPDYPDRVARTMIFTEKETEVILDQYIKFSKHKGPVWRKGVMCGKTRKAEFVGLYVGLNDGVSFKLLFNAYTCPTTKGLDNLRAVFEPLQYLDEEEDAPNITRYNIHGIVIYYINKYMGEVV